ncbi:right-handed parallel beta-helix repeat-containing protein [Halegenticoccus tardaugens]|uniref:right-handed parallel beta-helix repeat-containing protein n=1 Tax=Halegenticoccus tardaugens TaxID=2071624 RepID=UPI00100BAF2D|nr:right-handed parallel beta-helix repeat-containing protein [Halegenticoccus tardaugens]
MARELEVHDDDDKPPISSGNEGLLLERRSYLQMAGAAAAALATGATGVAAAAPSGVSEKNYGNVVDVVEAGADNSGGSSIEDVVQENANDNTLLKFPKGKYAVGEISLSGLKNFAMVAPEGASLLPESEGDIIRVSDAEGVHIEGFDVEGAARVIFYAVGGENTLKNWRVKESMSEDSHGAVVQCVNEDTVLTFENVDFSAGGAGTATWVRPPIVGDYPSGENVVEVEPSGTINFINCKMENWNDEGLYASPHPGDTNVIGGRYANSNLAQVRVGGENSLVKGVEIVCDDSSKTEEEKNTRGIWMKEGHKMTVEDCDIVMTDVPSSEGAIVNGTEGGEMHIKNTRIKVDHSAVYPIQAKSPKEWPFRAPSQDSQAPSRKVVVENVSITGGENAGAAINISRDDSEIRNVCIQQESGEGIQISGASGVTVADSTINVPEGATNFSSADVDTKNISESGSCPVPKLDGKPVDSGNLNSPSEAEGSRSRRSDGSELSNTISIRGANGLASYELTVDGKLESNEADGGINSEDNIKGSTAEGAVNGGVDSYAFSGEITGFQFTEGSATVVVNGEEADPASLGSNGKSAGSSESTGSSESAGSSVLSIRGDQGLASYELTVDGKLEASDAGGAVDSEDNIKGSTAEGAVDGGVDSYAISGELTDFRFIQGSATVFLDGEEANPDALGSGGKGDERSNVVVIDGTGENGESQYEFSVSGSVEKTETDGATVDEDDTVEGSTVSGSVYGGKDAYCFSGDVTRFRLSGSATVNFGDKSAE